MSGRWERVRAVADAVLYEGYLLYPYRANSRKNQSRWQFGVLGPDRAAERGIGEDDTMSAQLILDPEPDSSLTVVVRSCSCSAEQPNVTRAAAISYRSTSLVAGTRSWLSWDEAVECELSFGPFDTAQLATLQTLPIAVAGGTDIEVVDGGRLVRTRCDLRGELALSAEPDDGLLRISLAERNTGAPVADKDDAIAASLIGTHLIAEVSEGGFVSLLDPPRLRSTRWRAADSIGALVLADARRVRSGAGVADHPLRPPGDRRTERGCAVRLHGDRRDPHPAGDDDDR